ncbi:MAG: amino acid permease [Verrucomicrobia bacterium]|nr:amino acid permease [Verrucomicrobiota bacterium]
MENGPRISLWTATAIVVANMVGTGVFTSLGFQVADIPSAFPVLLLWVVGGVAALCGALSYGELAAALPRSGGEYHFLSRIYHPAIGFMAGWLSVTVGFAAPAALAAMAFGTYLHGLDARVPALDVSLALVWIVSLIHLVSIRQGSRFQNIFTAFKLLLLLALIFAGSLLPGGNPQAVNFFPVHGDAALILSSPFAVSLVYVMYAYSGWNAATYIVHEIDQPQRNVPRALLLGTVLVSLLYVGVNAVFLRTTPLPKLSGQLEVGLIAGREIFGEAGGRIMGGLICFGLISSVSAMVWVGPRVAQTMGQDFRALRWLARCTRAGVPAVASAGQLLITTALLLTATFQAALVYIQFSLILSSFLTVLGVLILRWREPQLPRPYRVWGYPVTPFIFLIISGYMLVFICRRQPWESLAGVGTLLLGLVVYFVCRNFASEKNPSTAHELPAAVASSSPPPSDPLAR